MLERLRTQVDLKQLTGSLLRAADRWAFARSPRWRATRAELRRWAYGAQVPRIEALTPERVGVLLNVLRGTTHRPLISIVTPVYRPRRLDLLEAVASVRGQLYPEWELILVDDGTADPATSTLLKHLVASDPRVQVVVRARNGGIAAATNAGIERAQGELVGFLDQDDVLEPTALLAVARALEAEPHTDLLYTDEDKLDPRGRRCDPQLKPGWSPELLLSYAYLGHFVCVRRTLLNAVGGLRSDYPGAADHDLWLRLAERTGNVVHLPEVLYHWRAGPGSTARAASEKPESIASGRRALESALVRRGLSGTVERPGFARELELGIHTLRLRLSEPPPVTILVPTDLPAGERSAFLPALLRSQTRYPELVIERVDGPPAIALDRGIREAHTEFVLCLSPSAEPLGPGWLDGLVGHAARPGIGAVGGKLLDPQGRVVHAGTVCGAAGLIDHAFRDLRHGLEHGYMSLADCLRNVSAVSAACLLTTKTAYLDVGGFDVDLPEALFEVDYCLKLRGAGYRIVYDPSALLCLTGQLPTWSEAEATTRFRERWRRQLGADPYCNAALSLQDGRHRLVD